MKNLLKKKLQLENKKVENKPKKLKKKKYKKIYLPKEIIVLKNKDKIFQEKWTKKRDLMNIPHSYRMLIFGNVDSGKTNLVKNIVMRAFPPFEKIIIIHYDPSSLDYNELIEDEDDVILQSEIPDPKNDELFDNSKKTLLIFDEMVIKDKTLEYFKVNRCFGYLSSHKNCSIIFVNQEMTDIPPRIRGMSNFNIVFNGINVVQLLEYMRRFGIKKDKREYLVHKYLKNPHDALWFDKTRGSPARIRKNCYEIIPENEYI